jgi:hypothetical protein
LIENGNRQRLKETVNVKRLLAILILAIGFASAATVAEADWKEDKLGHLARYIGTSNFKAILNDPAVKAALEHQVGPDLPELMRNMDVHASIDFIGRDLVLDGGRPHETNKHGALVVVNVFSGEAFAGIFTEGKYVLYTRKSDKYIFVPDPVWLWLHSDQISGLMGHTPTENFEWIKR